MPIIRTRHWLRYVIASVLRTCARVRVPYVVPCFSVGSWSSSLRILQAARALYSVHHPSQIFRIFRFASPGGVSVTPTTGGSRETWSCLRLMTGELATDPTIDVMSSRSLFPHRLIPRVTLEGTFANVEALAAFKQRIASILPGTNLGVLIDATSFDEPKGLRGWLAR